MSTAKIKTGGNVLAPGALDDHGKVPFNVEFRGVGNRYGNHELHLNMTVHLQQITLPPDIIENQGNSYLVQSWTSAEWMAFKQVVAKHGNIWNRRFVLVPLKPYKDLMFTDPASPFVQYMPNIECHFNLTVQDSPANAHHTIKVARLSDGYLLPDSGTFRSNSMFYDSADGNVAQLQIPDNQGNTLKIDHYTIPHEIGHFLGQPHIGELKNLAACSAAKSRDPKEGKEAPVCYGSGEMPSIAENIMGYGLRFTFENAYPWVWTVIDLTTGTANTDWDVQIINYLPPRLVQTDWDSKIANYLQPKLIQN